MTFRQIKLEIFLKPLLSFFFFSLCCSLHPPPPPFSSLSCFLSLSFSLSFCLSVCLSLSPPVFPSQLLYHSVYLFLLFFLPTSPFFSFLTLLFLYLCSLFSPLLFPISFSFFFSFHFPFFSSFSSSSLISSSSFSSCLSCLSSPSYYSSSPFLPLHFHLLACVFTTLFFDLSC